MSQVPFHPERDRLRRQLLREQQKNALQEADLFGGSARLFGISGDFSQFSQTDPSAPVSDEVTVLDESPIDLGAPIRRAAGTALEELNQLLLLDPEGTAALSSTGEKIKPIEGTIGTAIDILDFVAETGFSFAKLEKPKGYTEALESFRGRSVLVQIALGVAFDPLIVLGALAIPTRASATVIRAAVRAELAIAMKGASKAVIKTTVDDVTARLGRAVAELGDLPIVRLAVAKKAVAAGKGFKGTGGLSSEEQKRLEFLRRILPDPKDRVPAKRPEPPLSADDVSENILQAKSDVSDADDALKSAIADGADAEDIAELRAALADAKAELRQARKPFDAAAHRRQIEEADLLDADMATAVKNLEDEIAGLEARSVRELPAGAGAGEPGDLLESIKGRPTQPGTTEVFTGPEAERIAQEGSERLARGETTDLLNSILRKPVDPPKTPRTAAPGLNAAPESGRPRNIADLERESKGIRGLIPEQRAALMDVLKPTGDVLYQVEPYGASAARLLGPDTLVSQTLRKVPGVKQLAGVVSPAQLGRNNAVQQIGVRSGIFKEVERARARFAGLKWWNDADEFFRFKKQKGVWRATKVKLAEGVEPNPRTAFTINDIVENTGRYTLTEQQLRVVRVAQDMTTQMLRDAQRAGVDVTELSVAYWVRIVLKAPGERGLAKKISDVFIKKRLGSRKGHTMPRAFENIDEGVEVGYVYETHPLGTLVSRLEAGIETIANANARKELANLPGVVKPLSRVLPQYVDEVKIVRGIRDTAKSNAEAMAKVAAKENATNADRAAEAASIVALRQAEADFVTAFRDLLMSKAKSKQPTGTEALLPNGRIAPRELVEEINKYLDLPGIGQSGLGGLAEMDEIFRLVRSLLTTADLAAGFIQGQVLFYRNNVAWWKAQAYSIVALIDDPHAYVARNYDMIDEGTLMGAITSPTEFLFARQGIASIPPRIPLGGPTLKAFNRAFEWFILVGQTELYKAGRSRLAARGIVIDQQGRIVEGQVDNLVGFASAVRKGMGTESMGILGVRPTQQTFETLLFFASRFFRANTGIIAQSFTPGPGGAEARRMLGSAIAGATSLTIGIHYAVTGKAPNLTDPFAPDWWQVPIGKTYYNGFGPFYGYFRTIARMTQYMIQGEPDKAARELSRFLKAKASIPLRTLETVADLVATGESRTFEGDRITVSDPLSMLRGILGEQAIPIAPSEIAQGFQEGRPEAIAEILGLTGRASPFSQMDILFQKAGDINPERVSYKDAEPQQRDEMEQRYPEIAARMLKSGQGKHGEARRRWAEVDTASYLQEEALEQEFISGEISGDELRDRYGGIQSEKAASKAGINATLRLFQEDQDLPDDPNDRALAQYYRAQAGAVTPSGRFDYEKLEGILAALDGEWTTEQSGYVDRNTGRATHPPLIQEFRDDLVLLQPYFKIRDEFVASLSKDAQKQWELYSRDKLNQKYRGGSMAVIINAIALFQDKWVAEHSDSGKVDVALLKWGYSTTHRTSEGLEFVNQALQNDPNRVPVREEDMSLEEYLRSKGFEAETPPVTAEEDMSLEEYLRSKGFAPAGQP